MGPHADGELHYGIIVNGSAVNPLATVGPNAGWPTPQSETDQIAPATMTCAASHDQDFWQLSYECLIINSPAVRRRCEVVLTCEDARGTVLGADGRQVVLEEDENGRIAGNVQCERRSYYAPLQIGHQIACVP